MLLPPGPIHLPTHTVATCGHMPGSTPDSTPDRLNTPGTPPPVHSVAVRAKLAVRIAVLHVVDLSLSLSGGSCWRESYVWRWEGLYAAGIFPGNLSCWHVPSEPGPVPCSNDHHAVISHHRRVDGHNTTTPRPQEGVLAGSSGPGSGLQERCWHSRGHGLGALPGLC